MDTRQVINQLKADIYDLTVEIQIRQQAITQKNNEIQQLSEQLAAQASQEAEKEADGKSK